jgi:uncharacterized protein
VRTSLLIWCLGLVLLVTARAETLPPKPDAYFNDYAGIVSRATAQKLDEKLRQFERDSSNQVVVAIYKKPDTSSSIQDYTVRVAESWKVGQAGRNNGAVLFIFTEPRQMFIQVGYGLEGALPDILCKQIIENEIKPYFRNRNYDAGLTGGVDAILKATRGEYKGTGKVHGDDSGALGGFLIFLIIMIVFVVIPVIRAVRGGMVYSGTGRSRAGWGGGYVGSGWGGSGGGSSGGGGGGGFSGGGGSFGGGGAGGSW